jgi:hypothetical protein
MTKLTSEWQIVQMYLVHAVPLISTGINFYITDIVFIGRHYKLYLSVAFGYLFVNFVTVMIKGVPLYFFLTWMDVESYVIASMLMMSSVMLFKGLVMFSEIMK